MGFGRHRRAFLHAWRVATQRRVLGQRLSIGGSNVIVAQEAREGLVSGLVLVVGHNIVLADTDEGGLALAVVNSYPTDVTIRKRGVTQTGSGTVDRRWDPPI